METNALFTGNPPVINFIDMAKVLETNPQIHALQFSPATSLKVEAIPLHTSEGTILCDASTGTPWPLVPTSWRSAVFDSLHGLLQPEIQAT